MYGNSRSFDNSGFTYEYLQEQDQAALLRQQAYGAMATVPEGQLQMQMLGMTPQGLPLNPQGLQPHPQGLQTHPQGLQNHPQGLQNLSPQQQQQQQPHLPNTILQHPNLSPQHFSQF